MISDILFDLNEEIVKNEGKRDLITHLIRHALVELDEERNHEEYAKAYSLSDKNALDAMYNHLSEVVSKEDTRISPLIEHLTDMANAFLRQ